MTEKIIPEHMPRTSLWVRIGIVLTLAFTGTSYAQESPPPTPIVEESDDFLNPDQIPLSAESLLNNARRIDQNLNLAPFTGPNAHGLSQQTEYYQQQKMPGGSTSYQAAGCGIFAYTHIRWLVEGRTELPEDFGSLFFPDSDVAIPMATVAQRLRDVGYDVESRRVFNEQQLIGLIQNGGWDGALVSANRSENDRYGHIFVLTLDSDGQILELNSDYQPSDDNQNARWATINGVYLFKLNS